MKRTNNPTVHAISLDDLVFANKNKAYGAYMLRRLYSRHISIALALSVLIFSVFTVLPVVLNHWSIDTINNSQLDEPTGIVRLDPTLVVKSPDVKKPLTGPQAPVKPTIRYVVPIVANDPVDDYPGMPTIKELGTATPGSVTTKGDPNGIDNHLNFAPADPPANVPPEKVDAVVSFSEIMPAFEGGPDELFAFFARNVHYPEIAIRAGVEGKVMVQFIVEKDGSLSNVHVVKGIGAGCDEEAVRVCKLLTGWHAGIQNGKPVRVMMVIPFSFRLR